LSSNKIEKNYYKCQKCFTISDTPTCKTCGNINTNKMCENDNIEAYIKGKSFWCDHKAYEIKFCPICGEPICPKCECHDVSQVSRVTGYLSNVNGWNSGKIEELKQRKHYNIC